MDETPRGEQALPLQAFSDQRMPHLTKAASPAFMLGAFQAFFQAHYPSWSGSVHACTLDQVRYKPGRYCRFLYRLHLVNNGRSTDQWFTGKMRLAGQPFKRSNQPAINTDPHPNPWQAVNAWPELDMTLVPFPHDKRLKQLQKLIKPAVVQALAQPQDFDLDPNWHCVDANVQQVKYMPRKRCVLRYDLTWSGPANAKRTTAVYSKTYTTGKSGYVFSALKKLWQAQANTPDALLVPRPVCHLAELDTYWQTAWPGTPLTQKIAAGSWQEYAPKIGTGLARLHLTAFTHFPLQGMPTLAQTLENARGDVENIQAFCGGDEHAALQEIITQLTAQQTQLRHQTIPQTTIHGTFKISQILVDGPRIAVVDFDDIAIGDPMYDVAEFLTSLLVLPAKHGIATAEVSKATSSFLSAYARAVPWPCDRSRIIWYATIFSLARIHSLLKGLKMRDNDQLVNSINSVRTDLPRVLGAMETKKIGI